MSGRAARGAACITLGITLGAAACAASSRTPLADEVDAGDAGGGTSGAFAESGVPDATPPPEVVFYAHTDTTLFRVRADDPKLALERVGEFDCVSGNAVITDLAVDREGHVAGVSQRAVYLDMKPESGVVRCGPAVQLDRTGAFYGGTFAPKGVLDPAAETLIIAGSDGELFAVDRSTGALDLVGHFGDVPADDGNGHAYRTTTVGKRWELSGDLVFVENGGAPIGFATVRDCPSPPSTSNCNRTDTLVEIDPSKLDRGKPGNVVKSVRGLVVGTASCGGAGVAYGSIFGVAARGGSVIGFSRAKAEAGGDLAFIVEIANADGTACLVHDATTLAGAGWAGAGVTTLAPVTAPPPK